MKKRLPAFFFAFLLVLFVTGPSVSVEGSGQKDSTGIERLPSGPWTFSCGPYVGANLKSMPVYVVSVTTNAHKGLTVGQVDIESRASKRVAAVKLSWRLFKEQAPDTSLLQGETGLLDISLSQGTKRRVEYPVVTFSKIYKPLLADGVLRGDYLMEVAVSEVHYEDGARWREGKELSDNAAVLRHNHRIGRAARLRKPYDTGCSKQRCRLLDNTWSCGDADLRIRCSVSTDGASCTSTFCGGDDELEF